MTLPDLEAWQKQAPAARSFIYDHRTGNYTRYILDGWLRRLDQSGPLASNFKAP